MEDQRPNTLKHIETVRKLLDTFCGELFYCGRIHDVSKLESPEREIFDEYTPKLKNTTYGSDEYKTYLKEMSVALDHHYAKNRHHPEHFIRYVCNGCFKEYKEEPNICNVCGYSQFQEESDVSQMNLVDLIEMLCDWKAATLRHEDGDVNKSIEINRKRFNIPDSIVTILFNTVKDLELK